jgi:outer membrane protein assembly factor BamB
MRPRTFVLLAALAAALPGLSPAPAPAMVGSQFRGDAAHVGVYPGAAPTLHAVKWRFHTKGKIFSSAAVADGIVYVGSNDGSVYALRARDGVLVWKHATHGTVNSSPAVVNGLLYVASLDGYVYALDATDGTLRWRFKTQGERRFSAPGIHGIAPRKQIDPDPFDVFLSSPAVADGTVYIGSGDHYVYALAAGSGALRWKFRTGNVVHATPAVANGLVYIGSWDRSLYALDAHTGRVRWSYQTGDDTQIYNQVGIEGSAAVSGDSVYFGCRDSFFYALDARTGALKWKHDDHGSWTIASPALAGSSVYFPTSDERKFFALEAATGKVRYSVGYDAFAYSSPAIAGDRAYFGTFDGHLYAVDIRNGTIVATFATDGRRQNSAKYSDAKGKLDLAKAYPDNTLEGIYVGLDHIYSMGSIAASPVIADGTLYVGSTDGTLYALS